MEVELKGLNEVLRVLHPRVYQKALNRTVNDIGTKAKNQMIRDVRKTYNIKSKDLKQFMKFQRSRYSDMRYVIDVRSSRFNAMRFSPRKLKKKGKMSVTIKKSNGRKTFKAGTFVAKNGALLQRVGNTQKITGVKTLSVAQMFGNKKILKDADEMAKKEFGTKLEHNFAFYISKA